MSVKTSQFWLQTCHYEKCWWVFFFFPWCFEYEGENGLRLTQYSSKCQISSVFIFLYFKFVCIDTCFAQTHPEPSRFSILGLPTLVQKKENKDINVLLLRAHALYSCISLSLCKNKYLVICQTLLLEHLVLWHWLMKSIKQYTCKFHFMLVI